MKSALRSTKPAAKGNKADLLGTEKKDVEGSDTKDPKAAAISRVQKSKKSAKKDKSGALLGLEGERKGSNFDKEDPKSRNKKLMIGGHQHVSPMILSRARPTQEESQQEIEEDMDTQSFLLMEELMESEEEEQQGLFTRSRTIADQSDEEDKPEKQQSLFRMPHLLKSRKDVKDKRKCDKKQNPFRMTTKRQEEVSHKDEQQSLFRMPEFMKSRSKVNVQEHVSLLGLKTGYQDLVDPKRPSLHSERGSTPMLGLLTNPTKKTSQDSVSEDRDTKPNFHYHKSPAWFVAGMGPNKESSDTDCKPNCHTTNRMNQLREVVYDKLEDMRYQMERIKICCRRSPCCCHRRRSIQINWPAIFNRKRIYFPECIKKCSRRFTCFKKKGINLSRTGSSTSFFNKHGGKRLSTQYASVTDASNFDSANVNEDGRFDQQQAQQVPLWKLGIATDEETVTTFDSCISETELEPDKDKIAKECRSFFEESEVIQTAAQVQETVLKQKHSDFFDYPFFVLDVQLLEGKDLVVRDSCGTSDPYVKFKVGGKQVYRSKTMYKNLNPRWDETFSIPIEDVYKPVSVKVFDYDRGFHDDPMGNAEIDLSQMELGKRNELKLMLSDRGKEEYMGFITLICTLEPKTEEDKEQFMRRSVRSPDSTTKKLKMQTWVGVVNIVLVEGKDLVPMDDNGLSDPYVKFQLGKEKCKSKNQRKTLDPKWLEQFDLRMFPDQSTLLEISVYDYDVTGKDDFMGRAVIELKELEHEITHNLTVELEDGAGQLKLLLTISGTFSSQSITDLANFTPTASESNKLRKKYSPFHLKDLADVGHLRIKVFKAQGLKSADLGGQSDPFCVVELVNARLQTHTEYKTLNPEWNKVFTIKVRDIHSVLELTVYDEDRDKKVEFLGKVAIPLLNIRSGERRWYALKDKKLMCRTKGAIQVEIDFVFNPIKAAIRTVNPREEKYMEVEPKFKINVMKRNIDRVTSLVNTLVEGGKFLQSCFSWESTPRSATAFIVFLVIVWNFEVYMLPISLLLFFFKNLIVSQIVGAFKREQVDDEYFDDEDEEEDEEKEKEEKKSFKEKLQSIQDVCLQVQQGMDMAASLGERVKNVFNWSVPWLSTLAVVVLSVGVFVLYFVPIRFLILAWGINKFTKKLRKPNAISNNELLDFLSCVPSDDEMAQYRELRPEVSPTAGKKKRS